MHIHDKIKFLRRAESAQLKNWGQTTYRIHNKQTNRPHGTMATRDLTNQFLERRSAALRKRQSSNGRHAAGGAYLLCLFSVLTTACTVAIR